MNQASWSRLKAEKEGREKAESQSVVEARGNLKRDVDSRSK